MVLFKKSNDGSYSGMDRGTRNLYVIFVLKYDG
jgi:hypothetical protein